MPNKNTCLECRKALSAVENAKYGRYCHRCAVRPCTCGSKFHEHVALGKRRYKCPFDSTLFQVDWGRVYFPTF